MNKQFLIFLFFLFLSGMFWLMMTLNETYEKEICVPVRLVGQPKNVVVTTEMEDTVKVMVRDKGYTLATYLYGDRISAVNVNFATYANNAQGRGFVPAADLQKLVLQKLSASSKITAIKPDRLDFYFSHGYSLTCAGTIFTPLIEARSTVRTTVSLKLTMRNGTVFTLFMLSSSCLLA